MRPKVLITREVDARLQQLADRLAWDLSGEKTMKILPVEWEFIAGSSRQECWIVTSKNACEAVATAYNDHQQLVTAIVTVGHTTAAALQRYGVRPSQVCDTARALVADVEWRIYDAVRFFCGNNRRNEIPDKVRELPVPYYEQVVYHSEPMRPKVATEGWDGIICTSPLSSMSIFANQDWTKSIPIMTMGPSTYECVRDMGFSDVLMPSKPSLGAVFEEFDKYLRNG